MRGPRGAIARVVRPDKYPMTRTVGSYRFSASFCGDAAS